MVRHQIREIVNVDACRGSVFRYKLYKLYVPNLSPFQNVQGASTKLPGQAMIERSIDAESHNGVSSLKLQSPSFLAIND